MSKGLGPFWHEKYILLDAVIFIGLFYVFIFMIPGMIDNSPSHWIIFWLLGILITLIIFGFKFWLVWFIESKNNKKFWNEKGRKKSMFID